MLILKTWLQYLTDLDFFGLFMKIIRSIFLALDGIIYAIISYCYEVFTFISEIRVFENEDMVNLANRIYILIGVVSLFLVAYTLLNAIINPENATKDKNKSFTGIVKNIILAIIGIAIVPTIFDYAYEFQSRVLCNNVIQKFFLENNITEDDDARAKMGAQMSLYLFKSFYYIKGSEDDTSLDENANSNWETMAQSIVSDNDDSYNLSMAFSDIELGNRSISEALGDFDDSIDSGKLGYLFLISTLAGAFCAYVILGFVIDMGVRAVKLAYLQLIAPLPILTLILPNQKKVFDNWLKKTSSCFIEVFTRIIAMSFAFYAIKYLRPWIFNDMSSVSCGRTVGAVTKLLAQAAFIVGVFAFLKQLPKFIKDLLPGFDSAGFKLGFGNAFAEAGGFQALGMAGGAITSGVRNIAADRQNLKDEWNKPLGKYGKIGRLGRTMKAAAGVSASGIAGAVSGGAKSLSKGKDAKKWSDSVKFAGEGADEVMEAKLKRADYRDTHGGTTAGAIAGHIGDAWDSVMDYPNSHRANYKHESKKHDRIEEIVKAEKAVNDRAKEIMDKHAHKIVYGGKTLKSIRDDEEEAKQKYNAAIQAEASAKTNGGNVAAAAAAVTLARQKYDNAHKKTLDSEKAIKREIKLGNVGTGWGVEAAELQDMTSLYNQYHTAFKDNIDALYDGETYDDATYADLKALANQEPNLFRSNVITADDAENTVVHDESGNTHKTSVAGAIKFSAARVESKMNKESEAARKQQEGKK